MKDLEKPVLEYLPPIVAYLDDVRALFAMLSEQGGIVTIVADRVSYDGIEEFAEHAVEPIRRLEFTRQTPRVSLTLTNSSTQLYAANDELTSVGICEKLRLGTKRCSPRFSRLLNWRAIAAFLAFAGVFAGVAPTLPNAVPAWIRMALLTPLVVGLLWWLLAHRFCFGNRTVARLRSRSTEDSFWIRKKDDIWLALIVAFITSFITLFVSKLVDHR